MIPNINQQLKNKYFILILTMLTLSINILAVMAKNDSIFISFPKKDQSVSCNKIYCLGQNFTKNLKINNKSIKLYTNGFFATLINLNYGKNTISINNGVTDKTFIITRNKPNVDSIIRNSIYPNVSLGVLNNDTVTFSIKAQENSLVKLNINNKSYTLKPSFGYQSTESNYGRTTKTNSSGLVKYFYELKVDSNDNFNNTKFDFTITKNDDTQTFSNDSTITIMKGMLCGIINKNNTVTRTSYDGARTTVLAANTQVKIDGYANDCWRVAYLKDKHVWIKKSDIDLKPEFSAVSMVSPRTINIEAKNNYEIVKIPLSLKLPYEIKQSLTPNQLIVSLFGSQSNIEWITNNDEKNLKQIKYVSFEQENDTTTNIIINFNSNKQWGYFAQYEDNNLCIYCKCKPKFGPDLKGLKICIDPGHGGYEIGSIGLSGMFEKTLNLQLALSVKKYLEQHHAQVFITRQTDKFVDLYDRVEFAKTKNCDMLISIHNNSLPINQDPITNHGSSTYWYHIQSEPLAASLEKSLVKYLNFNNYGTRYQSLVLDRDSSLLAVLIEVGFMINPDDFSKLLTSKYQNLVGCAVYNGIKNYLGEK